MRKFSIQCDFGGQMGPFTICIGSPKEGQHPIHFQSDWLSKERGGQVPPDIMNALSELQNLALKNNVPLEDLCVYAFGTDEEKQELEAKEGAEIANDKQNK